MRQLDRLVMRELVAPWLFGVGLFTALLMAATYLGRLAGLLVDQVPPGIVGELFMLYMPAILVKTFTMAVLLAALLAFGRLSSDSEIVALRAGGASILRIVMPVMVFSLLIAGATFLFDEQVVPNSSVRSKQLLDEISHSTKIKYNQPIALTYVQNQKLRLGILARNVDPATRTLQGVTLVVYDDQEREAYLLMADTLSDEGLASHGGDLSNAATSGWRLKGHVRVTDANFKDVMTSQEAWPSELPHITKGFAELTAERNDDFDSMSMKQLRATIQRHQTDQDWKPKDILNAEYGYWNKIATPLAAFIFGTLGAVLGIRNHRTGTMSGFALAIAIIFGYVTLLNFMNVWALGGHIPPYVASFSPLTLGLIASGIIMWRRNA